MAKEIEVFVARCDDDVHPFFSGEPESIGFYTEDEIGRGVEKKDGGPGFYSYSG